MAQGQKLKGRLIDKDHYPVKNAKVTVKAFFLVCEGRCRC